MKKDTINIFTRRNSGLLLGIAFFLLLWLVPIPSLSGQASKALAISVMVATWWILGVMPPVFPALLACVLFFVMKVAPPVEAFAGFTSPSIWMLIFALIISRGVDRSGLAKRLASLLLLRMPATFNGVVGVFIALCFIFPFFIPSAAATTALIMTLALGVLDVLGR